MNGYLVDTNIPSELTRPRPEPRVAAFLRQAAKERLYVSTLTFGEICHGIGKLRPEATAKHLSLQLWLDTVMRPWFAGRVLAVTAPVAERWGFLSAEAKDKGRTLPVIDGLIAATALEHELALVTRNERNFVGLGVSLLNPWEAD